MIRYRYTDFFGVPAPLVHASLRCPNSGKQVEDVPALVDSGADRTIVPENYVNALQLVQMGHITVAGYGGVLTDSPAYIAAVAIRSLPPVTVKVLANAGESLILLGRDVLNHFRLTLDGPQQTLEIG